MNPSNNDNKILPKCGFGLTGLCCQSCLSGPCRLHPLEPFENTVDCGKSPDLLVATNLLRMVSWESLQSTGSMISAAIRVRQSSGLDFPKVKSFLENVSPGLSGDALKNGDQAASALTSWIDDFLSVFHSDGGHFLNNDAMYPKHIFPNLHHPWMELSEPLMALVFEGAAAEIQGVKNERDILRQCLKQASVALAAAEIHQELQILLGIPEVEKPRFANETRPNPVMPEGDFPQKWIVIGNVSDTTGSFIGDFLQRTTAPLVQIGRSHELPGLLRNAAKEGFSHFSPNRTAAVVFSSSPADVIIPLILGFNTSSYPPLLLNGSKTAGTFFREVLKNHLGVSYVPSDTSDPGDMASALQGLDR